MVNNLKKLLVLIATVALLVGCTPKEEQTNKPVDQPETTDEIVAIESHKAIYNSYDALEEGHAFVEYDGDNFKKLMKTDKSYLVFIGRPS